MVSNVENENIYNHLKNLNKQESYDFVKNNRELVLEYIINNPNLDYFSILDELYYFIDEFIVGYVEVSKDKIDKLIHINPIFLMLTNNLSKEQIEYIASVIKLEEYRYIESIDFNDYNFAILKNIKNHKDYNYILNVPSYLTKAIDFFPEEEIVEFINKNPNLQFRLLIVIINKYNYMINMLNKNTIKTLLKNNPQLFIQLDDSDDNDYIIAEQSGLNILEEFRKKLNEIRELETNGVDSTDYNSLKKIISIIYKFKKDRIRIDVIPKEIKNYYEILNYISYNDFVVYRDPELIINNIEHEDKVNLKMLYDFIIDIERNKNYSYRDLYYKICKKISYDDMFALYTNKIFKKINSFGHNDLFADREYIEKLEKAACVDSILFRNVANYIDIFEKKFFSEKFLYSIEKTRELASFTGKINTLESNINISFNFIDYLYGKIPQNMALDLIKYETSAIEELIKIAKEGRLDEVVKIYNYIINKSIIDNNDKAVHYIFRYFSSYRKLIYDCIKNDDNLTQSDLENLKKIILYNNELNINSFEELKKYDELLLHKIKEKGVDDTVEGYKNVLSSFFGYENEKEMADEFDGYGFDESIMFNIIREKYIKKYKDKIDIDKLQENWKKMYFNDREMKIIKLINKIIKTENLLELKDLYNYCINNNMVDLRIDINTMKKKVRDIYTLEFNMQMTSLRELETRKKTEDGIDVIDLTGDDFYFLLHTISADRGFDEDLKDVGGQIIENPELWTKFEGSTTLSTSAISSTCLKYVKFADKNVHFLFNNCPPNFLLCMYPLDLGLEHGGYKLEPKYNWNNFATFNGVCQYSLFLNRSSKYTEVGGYREGMLPCAIASFGKELSDDEKNVAKKLGIPIVKIDIDKHNKILDRRIKEAYKEYSISLDEKHLEKIFFAGRVFPSDTRNFEDTTGDNLIKIIKYCLDCILSKYKNEEIEMKDTLKKISEMEKYIIQAYYLYPNIDKIKKILMIIKKSVINNVYEKDRIKDEADKIVTTEGFRI